MGGDSPSKGQTEKPAGMGREEEYRYLKGWVRHLSAVDPPTGLLNRHGWITVAARYLKRAARSQKRVGVILADLDHFQRVNDEHGYDVGEEALQHVAEVLESQLRPGDLLGRWLEEEFILFLLSDETEVLAGVAERLRKAVEAAPMVKDKIRLQMTISVGAVDRMVKTGDLKEMEAIVSEAERRVIRAKEQGRNRVVV
jgi:diguanylate cyclase (GGDEF)-like protein